MTATRWAPLRWPSVIALAGSVLSLLAMFEVERHNQEVIRSSAQRALDQAADQVEARLDRYRYGLIGARGALAITGADAMDAATFRRYSQSRDYAQEFPGARGFGFIRRVPAAREADYVARMRAAGRPGFTVRQLHPHDGVRAIIELIEPIERNGPAVGLDIASESERRRAADDALRSGQATLTGPITLVQATGKAQQSFLLLLPVFGQAGAAAPRDAVGWTYAPLVMSEVLDRLGGGLPDGFIALDDTTDAARPQRFYASGAAPAGSATLQHQRAVLGRQWRATFQPGAQFVAQLHLAAPAYAGSAGFLLTLLCAVLGAAYSQHQARQQRLRATQAELAAIVDSSADAIIGSTPDGAVTSWNPGAERMFGYTAHEAIGRRIVELIVPPELMHEERDIQARIRSDQPFAFAQTQRRRKDGGLVEVSVAVAPIRDSAGAVVGASKTLRDISALVSAQTAVTVLNASLERQVAIRTVELEAARRDLRTVLDAMPSMIGYWDKQLVNRVANRAYGKFFGIDAETVPGMSMRDLLGETLFALNQDYIAAALRGEPVSFERNIVARDGTVRHSLAHYLPDMVDGVAEGFYVIIHDVTELVSSRQALASALRENDVLVRTINEQLLYSVTDARGVILEVNDNFCSAVGYRRDVLVGADHRLLKSGEHDDAFWADLWQTIAAGKTWHGTICNLSAAGERKWFDTVIAPYFDEHRAIARYVAVRTDVTSRQAADAALRHLTALLGNVLRAASEMSVIATDTDGAITLFNSGAERMLGYRQDEMVGRSSPAPLHDATEVQERAHALSLRFGRPVEGFRTFVEVPEREGSETREWTYVRKDGSRFPVSLTVTAMRDEHEAIIGFLGIATDISQRKRDEEALRRSMQQVEQASLAKSQFVANMSHEIRTPMNAVLGMLELVRRTELTDRQRDYVEKASSAGTSLLGILNDILDFSRIDAGKLELDRHAFELEAMLRDLAAVLAGNNAGKSVEVMFDVDARIAPHLFGDRKRLQQVLINLAGNALKFTDHGHVVVGLEMLGAGADTVALRFSVRDTGIGIPASQQAAIFDGFTQAEASTARRFGGTGLGLAISARLVRLMEGELRVSSAVGQGSTFWFDVELGLPAQPALPAARLAHGLELLVVDDNAVSGEILVKMVQGLDCRADYAASGRAALSMLAEAAQAGRRYDAVLMDLRMPELDGLEAAAMIQGDPSGAPPVIIVTAYEEDALRAALGGAAAPFRACLSKPVTPGVLAAALAQVLATHGTHAATPVPAQRRRQLEGLHLLVVEDNQLNRQVALELLQWEGAAVDLAEGGLQGIAMATDPSNRYDAVIMDVQMPDVDGLEATRRIRRVARPTHLPIMAMTANASNADRDACLAAGMDAHIGKPIDIDEVVAQLVALCGPLRVTRAAPAAAAKFSGVVVDFEGALRRFLGNADLYRRMLVDFEHECAQHIAQLERHVRSGDAAALAAVLHAFKGVAMTMGAERLARRLADAERDLKALSGGTSRDLSAVLDLDETGRLAAESVKMLQAALAAHSPAQPAADVRTPGAEAVPQRRLEELLELLDVGNLRALDTAGQLASAATADPALASILDATNRLQFAEAAAGLRALLRRFDGRSGDSV